MQHAAVVKTSLSGFDVTVWLQHLVPVPQMCSDRPCFSAVTSNPERDVFNTSVCVHTLPNALLSLSWLLFTLGDS